MSEEILNEVEQSVDVSEKVDESVDILEIPQRVNPFCVISKATFGEYAVRDIQTNSAWSENPYEGYAVVPDDMVTAIMETRGFCNIELNEEETEVVGFTAREIPEIPTPEPEPSAEERIAILEAENEQLKAEVEMQAEVLDFLLMQ